MSDSALSIGLHSVEYYRELKKIGPATDRELQRVERRIEQFERRADRSMARRLTATQRHVRAEMERIAADGARANAAIESRLDRDMGAARRARDAAMLAEHRRRETRLAVHASRMESIQSGHIGRMGVLARLGPMSAMAGMPGLGRIGSVARMGPVAGVAAAGIGTAALGGRIVRDAAAASPDAVAALRRAQSDLAASYAGVVEDSRWWAGGISRAVGATGSALSRAWNTAIDITAFYAGGFDGANVRGVNQARATMAGMDEERRRRFLSNAIGDSVFGVDPMVARRRGVYQAIEEGGLQGSPEAAALIDRLVEAETADRAQQAAEMRRANRAARAAEEQRRVEDRMIDAQTAAERARATEGFDDDKRAAQMRYLAELEAARTRVLADETIPETERHNRIMRESALLGAQYATVLRQIEEDESARARRVEAENKQRAESLALFQEQLAIEEAAALGQTKRAAALRSEADLRRRMEEIDRLGLEGNARAEAERRALAIRDAELAGKESGGRVVGWAGLAGGATLLRQIAGGGGPQQKMLRNSEKMVRVLEQIRDKTGVAVAAP